MRSADIDHLANGAANGQRTRRLARHLALWTEAETQTLISMRHRGAPYAAIAKKLRRSYASVRGRAEFIGLTPKRHVWTGAEISRLRKIYPHGTAEELLRAFPFATMKQLEGIAYFYGIKRANRPFGATGHEVIDQLRTRASERNLSMRDVDTLAKSGNYFEKAGWCACSPNYKSIAEAVKALGGELEVIWDE